MSEAIALPSAAELKQGYFRACQAAIPRHLALYAAYEACAKALEAIPAPPSLVQTVRWHSEREHMFARHFEQAMLAALADPEMREGEA